MKKLFTDEDFNKATLSTKLPCECYECGGAFYKQKKAIIRVINELPGHVGKYCSSKCHGLSKKSEVEIICTNCNNTTMRGRSVIKKSKTGNFFCSQSCAGTYNNKHKTHGNRRSKLEVYIESQLSSIYVDLDILFNEKNAIGSELDIYIPSLNLAFELNGIFHYEPIFGSEKFEQIKNNDISKSKTCIDNGIDLCIIDSSGQKYFKEKSSRKYLDIITRIINERLVD